jgi:hypothetical protein
MLFKHVWLCVNKQMKGHSSFSKDTLTNLILMYPYSNHSHTFYSLQHVSATSRHHQVNQMQHTKHIRV